MEKDQKRINFNEPYVLLLSPNSTDSREYAIVSGYLAEIGVQYLQLYQIGVIEKPKIICQKWPTDLSGQFFYKADIKTRLYLSFSGIVLLPMAVSSHTKICFFKLWCNKDNFCYFKINPQDPRCHGRVGFYRWLVNLPCIRTETTTILPAFHTKGKILNMTSCVMHVVVYYVA